jgi:hypothetical protein
MALNYFAPRCNVVKLATGWPRTGLTQCRAVRGAKGDILGRLWYGRVFRGKFCDERAAQQVPG